MTWPATNLKAYAEVCGELLARGHARSGDPQVIAGYIGSGEAFAEAMAEVRHGLRQTNGKGLGAVKAVGKSANEDLASCLQSSHHHCTVILSGVWPFFGQTEPKDLRLLFTTCAMNFDDRT